MSWYSEQVFGGISGEAVNLVSRDALTEPLRPMEGQQWTEEKILECLNRNHRPKNPSDSALVYLKVAQVYDPLRSDPRFQELLKKLHLM